jgi:hypothetical protein
MRTNVVFFVFGLVAITGCNNTPAATDTGAGGGTDAGHDAAMSVADAGDDAASMTTDAGNDAASTTDTGSAATDAGCAGVLLTVIDVSSWCDITVNGGTAFGGAMETVCVPESSDVTLVQTAHSGFILGNWFGTDADTGSGDPGMVSGSMSTAHVTTGAAGTTACVSVCCPFPGGTGCPTTNSCP